MAKQSDPERYMDNARQEGFAINGHPIPPLSIRPATHSEDVIAMQRRLAREEIELNSPFREQFNPPQPPALPDIPDLDILQAADVIEQAGQPQVADVLRKLPTGIASMERLHGGPHHLKAAVFSQRNAVDATHHYALKAATFRGLVLRWYQWEERPKYQGQQYWEDQFLGPGAT